MIKLPDTSWYAATEKETKKYIMLVGLTRDVTKVIDGDYVTRDKHGKRDYFVISGKYATQLRKLPKEDQITHTYEIFILPEFKYLLETNNHT